MIKFENRFDGYAYREATKVLSAAIIASGFEEGQWITLDSEGKIIVSDGSKKSFIVTTSKREGRDLVSTNPVQKGTFLFGAYEITVKNNPDAEADTCFDSAGVYAVMDALKVTDGGILTPWESGVDAVNEIVAYVAAPVVAASGELRILVVG